jgi:hypothetical protein
VTPDTHMHPRRGAMTNSGIGGSIHTPARGAGHTPLLAGRPTSRRPPVRNPAAGGRRSVRLRHGLRAGCRPCPC